MKENDIFRYYLAASGCWQKTVKIQAENVFASIFQNTIIVLKLSEISTYHQLIHNRRTNVL